MGALKVVVVTGIHLYTRVERDKVKQHDSREQDLNHQPSDLPIESLINGKSDTLTILISSRAGVLKSSQEEG